MPTSVSSSSIADELASVPQMDTDYLMTGWFSMLDEQVLQLLDAYPQLGGAHRRFSQARMGIWPQSLTDQSWEEMKAAAQELELAVRSLGDIRIELCQRPTSYSSECENALLADGSCARNWHTDN